jgi:hypothetical protein
MLYPFLKRPTYGSSGPDSGVNIFPNVCCSGACTTRSNGTLIFCIFWWFWVDRAMHVEAQKLGYQKYFPDLPETSGPRCQAQEASKTGKSGLVKKVILRTCQLQAFF